MSEKIYTPQEAARKVLEKCQEVYNVCKAEKTKEVEKCGEISKEEMDKCGEMAKEEPVNPKLKAFLDKRKQKKTQKMEKMMGIGEKVKPSEPAPAQSAAPVNAPKPPVAGMKKPGM